MSQIGTPAEQISATGAPEQLSLLNVSAAVPLQFRLNERTRLSGLAHVAALRAQLAAQAAKRGAPAHQRGSRQAAA